ncbi:MAG: DNA/RNA nuclease SfsA [Clostridia bacterium]|nr:DNA/RNA nuclease SfsA [Clostridia bacterium]
MQYKTIKKGIFRSRPNRFIAYVEIAGKDEICHVKNTGRCKELLVEGATVYLEESNNTNRRTKYDLVAVEKGDRLINLDSQAPNRVFSEWATCFFRDAISVLPEKTFGNSRFDFCVTHRDGRASFVEVKGVTLEQDGIVLFPDAPTERGVKHLRELCECVKEGYGAYLFFVVQMRDVKCFMPNEATHPEFAEALRTAKKEGVQIYAVDCNVTASEMTIRDFVTVVL